LTEIEYSDLILSSDSAALTHSDFTLPPRRIPSFSLHHLYTVTPATIAPSPFNATGLRESMDDVERRPLANQGLADMQSSEAAHQFKLIRQVLDLTVEPISGYGDALSEVYALPSGEPTLIGSLIALWRWRLWSGEGWEAGSRWRALRGGI